MGSKLWKDTSHSIACHVESWLKISTRRWRVVNLIRLTGQVYSVQWTGETDENGIGLDWIESNWKDRIDSVYSYYNNSVVYDVSNFVPVVCSRGGKEDKGCTGRNLTCDCDLTVILHVWSDLNVPWECVPRHPTQHRGFPLTAGVEQRKKFQDRGSRGRGLFHDSSTGKSRR